jgi:penicillin-binding protein 1A
VELKPIPGLGLQPPPAAAKVAAANAAAKPDLNAQQRPAVLTKRGAEILVHLERLMDDATRALAERTAPERNAADAGATPGQARAGTIASASERADQGIVRGN